MNTCLDSPSVSTILAIALIGSLSADSETRTLTFFLPANSNTKIALSSSAGTGDPNLTDYPNETTANYQGNIEARFAFDPETLFVSSFEYTGGYVQVAETDPILNIVPSIQYTGSSALLSSITRTSSSSVSPYYLGYTPSSPFGASNVVAETGAIETSGLRRLANQGFERIYNNRTGEVMREVYTDTSPGLLFHRGAASIHLVETETTTLSRKIEVTLAFDFAETDRHDIALSPDEVIVTETGSWSTRAQFSIPSDYADWAESVGSPNADPNTENAAGIPFGILYAMNLPLSAGSIPTEFTNYFGVQQVRLILPTDGLRAEMAAEYSADLAAETWYPLDSQFYFDGPRSLEEGATGS
ncbi:MAG: hypothetical protein ACQKBU_03980, partial [Verrucomicrobiales bacterium]